MREVQYKILTEILEHIDVPDYIYAFEKNKSIPQMALLHAGQDVIISLDIKDFFPSIFQRDVQDLFVKVGIGAAPARLLSELCTYKYFVPQGSITAPKISNIVAAASFGREVREYARQLGLVLSIYADDITVSYKYAADEKIPTDASPEVKHAVIERRKFKALTVKSALIGLIEKHGFSINHKKTKIMRRNMRQWVCGAVVNDKVNMQKTERTRLRAIVHNCVVNGIESEAAKTGSNPENFIRKYVGRINWLHQLNPAYGAKLKEDFRKVALPYLRKFPEIEIPELSWNSSIELPVNFAEEMAKEKTWTESVTVTMTETPKLTVEVF